MFHRFLEKSVNILLALGGVTVAIIASELIVRFYYPQNLDTPLTSYIYQNDSETDYIFKPHLEYTYKQGASELFVYTNSLGLSDEEIDPNNKDHELRILFLGDSFTWGGYSGNLPEALPNLLEEKLQPHNKFPGTDIQVINAGVPGYGTKQEVALYKKLAPIISPDIVILGFFVGNDFLDNLGWTDHVVINDYLINRYSASTLTGLRVTLYEHSHLYRLFEFWNPVTSRYKPYEEGMRFTFFRGGSENFNLSLIKTEDYIDELIKATAHDDLPLIIVLIPARIQVEESELKTWLELLQLDLSAAEVEKPSQAIVDLLNNKPIILLDLLPLFKERNQLEPGALYVPNGHTSHRGNELIAEAIKEIFLTNPQIRQHSFDKISRK